MIRKFKFCRYRKQKIIKFNHQAKMPLMLPNFSVLWWNSFTQPDRKSSNSVPWSIRIFRTKKLIGKNAENVSANQFYASFSDISWIASLLQNAWEKSSHKFARKNFSMLQKMANFSRRSLSPPSRSIDVNICYFFLAFLLNLRRIKRKKVWQPQKTSAVSSYPYVRNCLLAKPWITLKRC